MSAALKNLSIALKQDLQQSVQLYFSPLRAVGRDFRASMAVLSHRPAVDMPSADTPDAAE